MHLSNAHLPHDWQLSPVGESVPPQEVVYAYATLTAAGV